MVHPLSDPVVRSPHSLLALFQVCRQILPSTTLCLAKPLQEVSWRALPTLRGEWAGTCWPVLWQPCAACMLGQTRASRGSIEQTWHADTRVWGWAPRRPCPPSSASRARRLRPRPRPKPRSACMLVTPYPWASALAQFVLSPAHWRIGEGVLCRGNDTPCAARSS